MRPDAHVPRMHGVGSIDIGSGGGVLGKILKWGRRAFPERQILLRSEGRVRHITLSRRVQATMAATAGVAAIALFGYTATDALILDRGAGKGAEADRASPADGELQARVDQLQRELAAVKASQAAKPTDGGEMASRAATEQLDARIKALQEARDRAITEQKELQRQLSAAQQAIDTKAQSLAQLNRTLDANRGELRQSDAQRQALQTRVQQLESDLDVAKRKLQQAAADHDKTVAEREQLAARLSDQARAAPSVPPAPNGVASGKAPSMDSVPAPTLAPRAQADRPPDQRSQNGTQNTGELEQLIASTGIDVEELLGRFAVPAGQGGPYVVLENAASPDPAPPEQWAEELQKIVMTLPLAAPLSEYRLESGFGGRPDPFTRRQAFHPGLDMVAPYRTPVYSTAPGVVKFTGVKSAYGKVVEIDHGHGIVTRFGHLHRITVARGQQIAVHQQVGELGSTGRSTGPHLHYEVMVNGTPTDPEKFLQAGKNVVQTNSRR